MGFLLQFVEGLLTIAGLVPSGAGHAAHPVELGAIEVVGSGNLRAQGIDTLLPFFEVVGVVALIGVDRVVVEFHDDGADTVEEVTVVCDHQQRGSVVRELSLEPLDGREVEVVRGLVEDEEIGLCDEHLCQGHTLLLPA